MTGNDSTGIILQARMGSSRMPGKMGRRFYDGKTLLRVILDRLTGVFDPGLITVATSIEKMDDFIEREAKKCDVRVFRGSESNVLDRFVQAAEHSGCEKIIRICADNPFIQTNFIEHLKNYNSDSGADYIGYRINKKLPAITSHLGFFPEWVKLSALNEINEKEIDPIYREHVTNYFYSDLNKEYTVDWVDVNYPVHMVRNARLTIDIESDFETADRLYRYLNENGMEGSDEQIFNYLRSNPDILKQMNKNIRANEK